MKVMTKLEDCVFRIWDRLGFQEGETGWVIEVNHNTYGKPNDLSIDPYIGEIVLTEEEAENLGLEELFEGVDIWGRDTGDLDFSNLVEWYSLDEYILDKLTELISQGG
jgi:hypothetical protein